MRNGLTSFVTELFNAQIHRRTPQNLQVEGKTDSSRFLFKISFVAEKRIDNYIRTI
jgi:hypothetical protein